MASLAAMQAIDALVAANWSHTPIIAQNTTGQIPEDASAYLQVMYPFAEETMMSTGAPGSNFFREDGAARICLYIPIGQGLNPVATPWLQRIDTLRAALRAKSLASGAGETIEASPAIQHDDSDDGAYHELSFALVYRYDVTG